MFVLYVFISWNEKLTLGLVEKQNRVLHSILCRHFSPLFKQAFNLLFLLIIDSAINIVSIERQVQKIAYIKSEWILSLFPGKQNWKSCDFNN